jgi:O-antigen chain-terminating methyltransferase
MVKQEEHLFDALYLNFEDRFRGTEKDIKERVKVYLPHVQNACKNTSDTTLLDVGCGRGEWLKLLKENHIAATGLDLNGVMVEKCRDAGLEVVQADVLTYLRSLEGNTLSVITGFHIVEHLPFDTMISLFDESLRVLKPGGMVVFETPNPENLMTGACDFYTDPSHKNPIPPHTLSYLVEARGFADIEILRLHPDDSIRIEDPFLNYYFTIGRDYAVIGFKE